MSLIPLILWHKSSCHVIAGLFRVGLVIELGVQRNWGISLGTLVLTRPTFNCSHWLECIYTECRLDDQPVWTFHEVVFLLHVTENTPLKCLILTKTSPKFTQISSKRKQIKSNSQTKLKILVSRIFTACVCSTTGR